MEMVYFGMMIAMKTCTRLYCEQHRAPHRSVRAYHAVPKVVLLWALSGRGLLVRRADCDVCALMCSVTTDSY
jgi:hypothetical protein